jgi:hypothetical protein
MHRCGTLDREAARERNRQRVLEELDRKLRERDVAAPIGITRYGEIRARAEGREKMRVPSETARFLGFP